MTPTESKDPIHRLSLRIDSALYERVEKMPWGVKSIILRILLEKVCDAADDQGTMIYGAIMDGSFNLVYKEKEDG